MDETYKLVSKEHHPKNTQVPLGKNVLGGDQVLVIAGPCAVESREQIEEIAFLVKEAGASALRGGAFKPRSSPYSFQGFGEKALQWLAQAREKTGLPIVTEIMDPALLEKIENYADVLQVGSRSMQNFALLKAVSKSKLPVLLKRGMSNTIEEFLLAAEYILSGGNTKVILCERGIRTFESSTRNTFDVNALAVLKHKTHLPVIADPSHAVGKWEYVEAIARSAIAAGADGLIVEVHPDPSKALSDGRQSLKPKRFHSLMKQIKLIAQAIERTA